MHTVDINQSSGTPSETHEIWSVYYRSPLAGLVCQLVGEQYGRGYARVVRHESYYCVLPGFRCCLHSVIIGQSQAMFGSEGASCEKGLPVRIGILEVVICVSPTPFACSAALQS